MGDDGATCRMGREIMPTVSVIIPAYNQGHYLEKAIQSVLNQTFADFEIIVVDDGSTDDTRQVVAGFSDPRVRYVYQQNAGLSAARNTGIRHAAGAFLSYLDSDDLFLPDKLAVEIACFERDPTLGFVAGQAILIDENGQRLGEIFDKKLPDDSTQLLLGNPLHVGSVLVRHKWQTRVGFFDETLRSYEDWDMWLRLALAGCQMDWVAQPVSLYRFHAKQMTRNGQQMTTATFAVLDKLYHDPKLPAAWQAMRTQAYSRAHLRAAAQAYQARAFDTAITHMDEAVRLNPELCAHNAERLAQTIAGWANYAKTAEPLTYLEEVYAHLPDSLTMLRHRRREQIAREAVQLAFAAHRHNDADTIRTSLWRAFSYEPKWLLNRGAVSLFVKSWWRARFSDAQHHRSTSP